MNEEFVFDLISLADDEFILEASRKKRSIRLGKRVVSLFAAAVVCAVMFACAAAAVLVTNIVHKGSLTDFYESDAVSRLESRGYTDGRTAETKHARLTVDSVTADKYRCMAVYTIEALDDEGDEQLKDMFGAEGTKPLGIWLYYADTNERIEDISTITGYRTYGEDQSRSVTQYVEIPYDHDTYVYEDGETGGKRKTIHIDRNRPLKIRFEQVTADSQNSTNVLDGLETELPVVESLKGIELYCNYNGSTAYISELGVTVTGLPDPDDPRFDNNWECKIVWKDGTWTEAYEIGRNSLGNYTVDGVNVYYMGLRNFIDLDKVDSAALFGIVFRRR